MLRVPLDFAHQILELALNPFRKSLDLKEAWAGYVPAPSHALAF